MPGYPWDLEGGRDSPLLCLKVALALCLSRAGAPRAVAAPGSSCWEGVA